MQGHAGCYAGASVHSAAKQFEEVHNRPLTGLRHIKRPSAPVAELDRDFGQEGAALQQRGADRVPRPTARTSSVRFIFNRPDLDFTRATSSAVMAIGSSTSQVRRNGTVMMGCEHLRPLLRPTPKLA